MGPDSESRSGRAAGVRRAQAREVTLGRARSIARALRPVVEALGGLAVQLVEKLLRPPLPPRQPREAPAPALVARLQPLRPSRTSPRPPTPTQHPAPASRREGVSCGLQLAAAARRCAGTCRGGVSAHAGMHTFSFIELLNRGRHPFAARQSIQMPGRRAKKPPGHHSPPSKTSPGPPSTLRGAGGPVGQRTHRRSTLRSERVAAVRPYACVHSGRHPCAPPYLCSRHRFVPPLHPPLFRQLPL